MTRDNHPIPSRTLIGLIVVNQTRPDQTRPDQTRPAQTRPDQTRPDQTRPDQTRPEGKFHFVFGAFPQHNVLHFPNNMAHFPNNMSHFPKLFVHFPNNFVSVCPIKKSDFFTQFCPCSNCSPPPPP